MYETRYLSIAILDSRNRVLVTSEQYNVTVKPKVAVSIESFILQEHKLMDEYNAALKQKLGVKSHNFRILDSTTITKSLNGKIKKDIYLFVLKPKNKVTLRFDYYKTNPSLFLPIDTIRDYSRKGKFRLSSYAESTLNFINITDLEKDYTFEGY